MVIKYFHKHYMQVKILGYLLARKFLPLVAPTRYHSQRTILIKTLKDQAKWNPELLHDHAPTPRVRVIFIEMEDSEICSH